MGNQRGPVDGRPLTLRRHLLAEALATEAENARAEASAEAAAAAWARERMLREAAAQTLWPRLDDVPAGLRCSGEADAIDISAYALPKGGTSPSSPRDLPRGRER